MKYAYVFLMSFSLLGAEEPMSVRPLAHTVFDEALHRQDYATAFTTCMNSKDFLMHLRAHEKAGYLMLLKTAYKHKSKMLIVIKRNAALYTEAAGFFKTINLLLMLSSLALFGGAFKCPSGAWPVILGSTGTAFFAGGFISYMLTPASQQKVQELVAVLAHEVSLLSRLIVFLS